MEKKWLPTVFFFFFLQGNQKAAKILLKHGAIDKTDDHLQSAVYKAAEHNRKNVLDLLIKDIKRYMKNFYLKKKIYRKARDPLFTNIRGHKFQIGTSEFDIVIQLAI